MINRKFAVVVVLLVVSVMPAEGQLIRGSKMLTDWRQEICTPKMVEDSKELFDSGVYYASIPRKAFTKDIPAGRHYDLSNGMVSTLVLVEEWSSVIETRSAADLQLMFLGFSASMVCNAWEVLSIELSPAVVIAIEMEEDGLPLHPLLWVDEWFKLQSFEEKR